MDTLTLYSKRKYQYRHAKRHLSGKMVKEIFNYTENAFYAGTPLNRFITIHLQTAKLNPQKFIVGLMEHTRKWLQRRNLPHAYVWVLENGQFKGVHVHIIMHIPTGYQITYKKALKKWLPFALKKPDVDIKTIGYPRWGLLHEKSKIYGLLKYICKGIEAQERLNGIKPSYQGPIIGRRCGMSRKAAKRSEPPTGESVA